MKPRTSGKPAHTEAYKIRILTWLAYVKLKTGMENNNQLEKLFFPKNFIVGSDGVDRRTKIFYQYERCETGPSEHIRRIAEEEAPGSIELFDLPFWDIIDEKPLKRTDLYNIIASIRPRLATQMRKADNSAQGGALPNFVLGIDALFRQGDISAFTVLLGLIRYGKDAGDDFLVADASVVAAYFSLLVLSKPPFYPVRELLFDYLKTNFLNHKFSDELIYNFNYIDIDPSVVSVNQAIEIFEKQGLIRPTSKDHGRLVYWMWREGCFASGICLIGDLGDYGTACRVFDDELSNLVYRLKTSEISNPKRNTDLLLADMILGLKISFNRSAEYLEEIRQKRSRLANRTPKEMEYL